MNSINSSFNKIAQPANQNFGRASLMSPAMKLGLPISKEEFNRTGNYPNNDYAKKYAESRGFKTEDDNTDELRKQYYNTMMAKQLAARDVQESFDPRLKRQRLDAELANEFYNRELNKENPDPRLISGNIDLTTPENKSYWDKYNIEFQKFKKERS